MTRPELDGISTVGKRRLPGAPSGGVDMKDFVSPVTNVYRFDTDLPRRCSEGFLKMKEGLRRRPRGLPGFVSCQEESCSAP